MVSPTTKLVYEKRELYKYIYTDIHDTKCVPLYDFCGLSPDVLQYAALYNAVSSISAYARSHQNLVDYINGDKEMIHSLVDTGYSRLLCDTGSAYINTGVVLNSTTAGQLKTQFTTIMNINSSYNSSWRLYGYDTPNYSLGISSSSQFVTETGRGQSYSGVNASAWQAKLVTYTADFINGASTYVDYLTGVQLASSTYTYSGLDATPHSKLGYLLFAYSQSGGGVAKYSQSKLRRNTMWMNGIMIRDMIPYFDGTVYGLLDISQDEPVFYKNASGSGSFSTQIIQDI